MYKRDHFALSKVRLRNLTVITSEPDENRPWYYFGAVPTIRRLSVNVFMLGLLKLLEIELTLCKKKKKKKVRSLKVQNMILDVFFTLNTMPLAIFPYHVRLLIYLAFYFEKFYYQIEIIKKFYSFDQTVKLGEYEGTFSPELNTVDHFSLSLSKLHRSVHQLEKWGKFAYSKDLMSFYVHTSGAIPSWKNCQSRCIFNAESNVVDPLSPPNLMRSAPKIGKITVTRVE